ncbi:hypothetical protein JXB31_02125 [Candidatus Woesearchaeota archaeon]|nr:hypothetical protein [Candidatus Woesearchaeota archaeon]
MANRFEFNSDGSLRLPEWVAKKNSEDENRLKNHRCIKISREVVSFSAPKRCRLHITLSDAMKDNRFVDTIYNEFKAGASVPSKLTMVSEKEFEIEIGTDFKRCTDCSSLINMYREFMDGCIIEHKGSCTFEGQKKNFCYEDYFS